MENNMNLKPIKYKERFEAMKNSPRGVVEYAQSLRHRIPELEHVVLRDELAIYWYARYVIGNRWPEGEKVLLRGLHAWGPNTYLLNKYAQAVIKDRWIEAEPALSLDKPEWDDYEKHFNLYLEL